MAGSLYRRNTTRDNQFGSVGGHVSDAHASVRSIPRGFDRPVLDRVRRGWALQRRILHKHGVFHRRCELCFPVERITFLNSSLVACWLAKSIESSQFAMLQNRWKFSGA